MMPHWVFLVATSLGEQIARISFFVFVCLYVKFCWALTIALIFGLFNRRLTDKEKEDLYCLRPDLKASPIPYFFDRLEAIRKRKQRMTVLTLFCGVFMVIALMLFYHWLSLPE
jgi:hypothetical protein